MLSASALDGLLAILATDDTFHHLKAAFDQHFRVSPHDPSISHFSGECACARFLSVDDVEEDDPEAHVGDINSEDEETQQTPTLRPQHRLAAIFLLARGGAPIDVNPSAFWSFHPFLESLIRRIDRLDTRMRRHDLSPDVSTIACIERTFLLQLFLPHLFTHCRLNETSDSPRRWFERASQQLRQEPYHTQTTRIQNKNTIQSTNNSIMPPPSELALALEPFRAMIRANQPPACLLPAPRASLTAHLVTASSSLAATIGPTAWAGLASVMKSSPAQASAGTVTIRLDAPPPRLPPPPLLPVCWDGPLAELEWMDWNPHPDITFEVPPVQPILPLSPTAGGGGSLASTIAKALRSQLLATERSNLLSEMRAGATPPGVIEPSHILRTILELIPPARIAQLIEKNHEIARELLLQFITLTLNRASMGVTQSITTPPTSINDYLAQLVRMDVSLHSMELVRDLALVDQVALPGDFLHLYISQCLTSTSKLTDKFLQNRHVRLICVFLQAMMRHKLIQLPTPNAHTPNNNHTHTSDGPTTTSNNISQPTAPSSSASASSSSIVSSPSSPDSGGLHDVRDLLFVEVQSFLVEFSRIKEAASLYKQICAL